MIKQNKNPNNLKYREFKVLKFTRVLFTCLPACLPASQPASHPASQPASQPANQPASQPVSQSASQPVSQPASLPVCLPAIRYTSSGRIWPVFSHNTGYQWATTDLLIWLRFIHCTIVSPFIHHCFSFSSIGQQKGEKLLKQCWWIVMAYTCYVTLISKCTRTWLSHPL